MSYNATHNAIRMRLYNEISSLDPETRIAWANAEFTPPNTGSWIRCTILDAESYQASMGASANMHRHVGLVVVNIFAPLLQGDRAALLLVDEISAIFRNWSDPSLRLRFYSPAVDLIGPEDKWYQVNVSYRFERDTPF